MTNPDIAEIEPSEGLRNLEVFAMFVQATIGRQIILDDLDGPKIAPRSEFSSGAQARAAR